MKIFAVCSDYDRPLGGNKKLYRHVDILNAHGFSAYVFHGQTGFRCTWFPNSTKIVYASETSKVGPPDYLLLPEAYASPGIDIPKGIKKVIFNQNCYYTFNFFDLNKDNCRTGYLDPEVVATLVVSDDSKNYLQHIFPQHPIYRIHNAIDASVFEYQSKKKRQIAFMLRKNSNEVLQVINILKFRGALSGYHLAPIQDQSEAEVAETLKDSMFFLSFGYPEGFSLSPAEAMACGCIVIGYHGMGGKEFFKEEFSYPVPQGDVLTFAKSVERALHAYKVQPNILTEKAIKASDFIRSEYSTEREVSDVISFWKNVEKEFLEKS